jgi:hypothetical protein
LVDRENQNLSAPEKELLEEHWKKCHVDAQRLQSLMREADGQPPIIATKHPGTRSCKPPLCDACCLAKSSTQGSDTYSTIPNPKKVNALVHEDLKPGDRVSLDQYVLSVPGRLAHMYGKENKRDKLTGGTIFVDHATGHVFIYNQVSARAGETNIGKNKYERITLDSGVSVQTYHADNGIFATKAFKAQCDYKGQELEFRGVGAHHQNGVAERAIQTVSYPTRTMILHMSLHWPEQADLELWPFALEHATYVWNHFPRADTRLSPQELYTGSLFFSYDHISRLHTLGCPVYVLHPRLQDGQKVPKWQPRSQRGQFMGYSIEHSSSIGLILNINTGNISPKYHVVHNDYVTTFHSVYSTKTSDAASWQAILQTGVECYLSDDIDRFGKPLHLPLLHDEWFTEEEQHNNAQQSKSNGPKPQREHFDDLPELPLSEFQREPPPTTAPSETMRVPRSFQRKFGCNNGGGGSTAGDSGGAPPRSQPPFPRLERPPATPLLLDLDDDVPFLRTATRVPVNEGLGRGMRRHKANSKYGSQEYATYQETLKQKVSGSVLTDAVLQSLDWDKSVTFLKSVDFLAFTCASKVN